MSALARKQPVEVAPVSPIETVDLLPDLRVRSFVVNGVRVQVDELNGDDRAAADLAARLHAVCSIPPAPPRIEAWGPGQFDRVRLGPGVEAWIRITPEGRVRLVVPGGDLDVTEGGSALGTGLHEATTRAVQIRVRLIERATKKAERLGHEPVWTHAAVTCRRCEATGEFETDGKARGLIFTARCA